MGKIILIAIGIILLFAIVAAIGGPGGAGILLLILIAIGLFHIFPPVTLGLGLFFIVALALCLGGG